MSKNIPLNSNWNIFKNKSYFQKLFFNFSVDNLKVIDYKISIRVTSNNIFCTLVDPKTNKIKASTSSGQNNVKTSKKTLRFTSSIILQNFLNNVISFLQKKKFLIEIISPIRLRKKILQQVLNILTKTQSKILVELKPMKCFNGCRPKKKQRKKRKTFRIFK
jgi:ribosomal protein S11